MARRPRSSRAWHFVLSAARRDADARAVALAGSTNWGYDSDGQHSDSDSDPEYASLPSSIPSAVPVTGESFCDCDSQSEAFCGSLHAAHRGRDCRCGEEDEYFDWVWDDLNKSSATLLSCDNRKVNFHMEYSCGTAAIRGTKELGEGQHFWEIKMTSPVYGTDMMVGIGTSDVDLDKYHHTFCSLLGRDEDSWGLSYTGLLHHKGDKTSFSSRFGQGSIIGVHLDTWHGTLTFFKNRKCIGEGVTLTCACRAWLPLSSWSGSHQAAEQEVLPDGVLHGGQEQHEGDPLLCQHHLPAVPVLLPPAPAAARLWGHARGPAPAARPQAGAAPQAGLGPEHELWPPQAPCALAHSQSQQPRDPALPEEALPKDLACFPVKTAFYSWDGVFSVSPFGPPSRATGEGGLNQGLSRLPPCHPAGRGLATGAPGPLPCDPETRTS
ncbi:SPRY domain-containing SOCS box protein 3 isoform X2 [Eubalaena glacialis]|uniref:SPRY domain-containing SOCS box protein 3 isoform X2 n=1 Tax=Eubalaena glacialis TaxID=27606 RepID=UPI002A5A2BFD|nr:SPRY domain-containing SOCS box protein 3 isoform X2 [Eubalaena glacialis]